jgi:ribosomal-protein-alanine N-acetyltransferase
MTTARIRAYRPGDEPDVLALLRVGLDEQAAYAAQVDPPEDAGYVEGEWEACTAGLRAEPDNWTVAQVEGRIAGLLWLERVADPFAPYGVVRQLIVAPDQRRRGIGSGLLDFAEAAAGRNGALVLMIGGLASNPAMDLYRRRGFTPVPEGYRDDPNPNHVVLWKRFLP